MPLFCSSDEYGALQQDGPALAARADVYVRSLLAEMEAVKAAETARMEAARITNETNVSNLEQKFLGVTDELTQLEEQKIALERDIEDQTTELARVKNHAHQLVIAAVIPCHMLLPCPHAVRLIINSQ